jgi:hypothetical protein
MAPMKHTTPEMIGRLQFPGKSRHPGELVKSCFRTTRFEAMSGRTS